MKLSDVNAAAELARDLVVLRRVRSKFNSAAKVAIEVVSKKDELTRVDLTTHADKVELAAIIERMINEKIEGLRRLGVVEIDMDAAGTTDEGNTQ